MFCRIGIILLPFIASSHLKYIKTYTSSDAIKILKQELKNSNFLVSQPKAIAIEIQKLREKLHLNYGSWAFYVGKTAISSIQELHQWLEANGPQGTDAQYDEDTDYVIICARPSGQHSEFFSIISSNNQFTS